MINFKVGILGAGRIAGTIADTLNKMDAFEPYAIASRDLNKANEFGDKYEIEKRYGSYEELINDPDVELIYIATPHSHHAEQAKMCINAGKPVLVEKAFSYNHDTAAEVFKLSEEKKVFCGEAMWMRYLPIYKALYDTLSQNVIGRLNGITCSLGCDLKEKERIITPELAGGALLDLGVYPINLMLMFFGRIPSNITSTCIRHKNGVDMQEIINFNYPEGQLGTALVTAMYTPDNNARLYGTTGYVEIENILNPKQIRIYRADGSLGATMDCPEKQISGYEFEFIAARNAIILGNVETPEATHQYTLSVMKICDTLRNAWSFQYPMESNANMQPVRKSPNPIRNA